MKRFFKNLVWRKVLVEHRLTALFAAVLIGVNLFVFAPSLHHVFRGDQVAYMIEMAPLSGLGELLKASYTYPRTREIAPGDQLLFRPLLYVLLAVETWLFRYDFFYWQLFSLILHIVVVLELYFVLQAFQRSVLAPCLALSFSVMFIGQEMVTWHHIVGYLLFTVLFLPGFYGALRYAQSGQQDQRFLFLSAACVGVSAFAYEFGIIAGGVLWLILAGQRFVLSRNASSPWRGPLWIFWLSPLIYAVWSVADYFQHITVPHPELWSFSWDVVWLGVQKIGTLLEEGLLFPAAVTTIFEDRARFLPLSDLFVFDLTFFQKLVFVFQRSRESLLFAMNAAALVCLGMAGAGYGFLRMREWFDSGRKAPQRKGRFSTKAAMAVAAGIILLAYFLLLLFGRFVSRSEELVYKSLYYVYLLALFLAMTGYFFLFVSGPLKGRTGKRIVALLSIAFLLLMGVNGVRTRGYLMKQESYQSLFQQYLAEFNRFIAAHQRENDFSFDIYWSNSRFYAWDVSATSIDQQDFANLLFRKYLNNRLPKYFVVYSIQQGLRAFRLHEEARNYVLKEIFKVPEEVLRPGMPFTRDNMKFPQAEP